LYEEKREFKRTVRRWTGEGHEEREGGEWGRDGEVSDRRGKREEVDRALQLKKGGSCLGLDGKKKSFVRSRPFCGEKPALDGYPANINQEKSN